MLQVATFTFAAVKKPILLFTFFLLSVTLFAADQVLFIKDKSNGKPVNEAVVVWIMPSGKSQILLPDNNGRVKLPKTEEKNFSIEVRCLGYQSQKIEKENSGDTIWLSRNEVSLNEVAVTASYAPAPAMQSAYAIKIISKESFDNMAAVNVADVLSKQLNMSTGYDQAFGSTLTMMGMDMKNIKVLIDGVPVIGRMNGNIDLNQLNLAAVERIEVVEGPMSTAYGTDAIAGAINLITKPQSLKKTTAGASAYYENIGTYNTDLNVATNFKHAGIKITAGRNFFEGWNLTDDRRVLEWKPKTQYFGTALLQYTFRKVKVAYQLGLFDEKITDKGPVTITPFSAYAYDNYFRTFRNNHSASYDWFLSGKNKLNGHVAFSGYDRNKETCLKDMVALEESELTGPDFSDETKFYSWNIRNAFSHVDENKNFNYQGGIDINIEKGTGKRINSTASMQEYAAFASAEYKPFSKLLIRPGLRYALHSEFTIPLIPSLNLKYDITNIQTVRLSYSRGFRTPGIKELYLDFIDINHNVQGNSNINPESSDNFQIVYSLLPEIKKVKLNSEVKLYYNKVKNLITLANYNNTSNLYTYINIGHFTSQGVEWSNTIEVRSFSATAGVSYTGTSSFNESLVNDLSWYPQANGSVSYNYKPFGLTTSVYYKYNGKVPVYVLDSNGNSLKQTNEDYQLLDVTVSKKLWKERVEIGGGLKNIFNVTDVRRFSAGEIHNGGSSSSSLLPGRLFFLKLSVNI
ncbi:MAG TPA: TonB-dependent receptor [Bacteroidia bacterium]|nr:TonB-dependent receptor [Bacteroidia bacterium]HQW49111.1 TonB-dependent receptor [Bacteroidia bacterium]HQX68801.1 TonB-dependent receptor [Bacteroidia bacterium]HRB25204.1 TonB-dependent receptor [Bacteroidia bacterium]HRB39880.1 TonB-dependent receptor [Bacteroidia bacterium]